ncbi:CubicO group peptidase (beta-lactamase class C family) [Nocardioides sp. J9]|uniref:serine hydrolase domain-containing protein n=1 Tax=Nocardioides sp. J9 TaxID=935844 RepID=UPI0011AC6374|nr:serine hydrolase domain-containing protein [Nocardioides sp. J9]TWG98563.1 CubicO group peptidase (beta-lactamase class C family) [Nocardioides sp. J9]
MPASGSLALSDACGIDVMTREQLTDERVERAMDVARAAGEEGLAVAAYLGDDLIIDTWSGLADSDVGTPVTADTLFQVFSVTKAFTATALHLLADRGLVDYDLPIARYWPEFGVRGKERITVRDALCHRAGIPQMPVGVTVERMGDWSWMTEQIANFRPWFPAGTVNAYHVLVWGWLIGEVIQRTDPEKRDVATFVADEVCAPLGITDFHMPLADEHVGRVTQLKADWQVQLDPDHLRNAAQPVEVSPAPPVHNQRATWQMSLPGAGGIANAPSVARLFAMLAQRGTFHGTRLLSEEIIEACRRPRPDSLADDLIFEAPAWIGQGGYWLGGDLRRRIPADGSLPLVLNQPGAGGSTGWAELDTGLAVAICHNRQFVVDRKDPHFQARITPIADAVREVAAERA